MALDVLSPDELDAAGGASLKNGINNGVTAFQNFGKFWTEPGRLGNYLLDPLDLSGKRAAATAFQNQQSLDQQARDFNSSEAALQRQWEEHMSSTAIQRQVADAKAAGINPAALFGNGASGAGADTPSGSSAASSSGNANIANNKLSAAVGAFALFVRLLLTKGK